MQVLHCDYVQCYRELHNYCAEIQSELTQFMYPFEQFHMRAEMLINTLCSPSCVDGMEMYVVYNYTLIRVSCKQIDIFEKYNILYVSIYNKYVTYRR